jgi:hypothetical protein
MPKIYNYLGIIILFYSNEHEPIHVHGKYDGKESKAEIIIDEGKVKEVYIKKVKGKMPLSPAILKDFEIFVNKYSEKIIEKWINYFVLHKKMTCENIEKKIL